MPLEHPDASLEEHKSIDGFPAFLSCARCFRSAEKKKLFFFLLLSKDASGFCTALTEKRKKKKKKKTFFFLLCPRLAEATQESFDARCSMQSHRCSPTAVASHRIVGRDAMPIALDANSNFVFKCFNLKPVLFLNSE